MLQSAERVKGLQRVNDFVVKFANVNGSGSASANALFAKSILRMGVPMTPRNIFPSNIQGLPTWYEVRVSEAGHLGARGGGVDLMVAMNPQTWTQDVAPSCRAATCSTTTPSRCRRRGSARTSWSIGVPLTEITNKAYTDSRQRQLFKNIVYLGALSALLEMDVPEIEKLLAEQFRGRDKLIAANVQALHMGRDWALANLECPIGLTLRRAEYGRRSHLHRGQCRRRAWRGVRRRDGVRVVSDHAVIVAGRGVHALLQSLPRRSGDEEEQVRHRSGGRRAGLDRHGDRRGVERRTRVHRDVGARHFADAGIRRPGVFRRDPRGDLRRAARRPVHRHADAHAADRHTELRLRLARRHQARAAVPRRSLRVLRVRRAVVRSGGPAADADLHDARPGDRHERPAVQAVRPGTTAARWIAAR